MGIRIIALVTDAYGGRGGIALYNRLFLRAVCSHHLVEEVVALPRCVTYEMEAQPSNMRFITDAAGSKLRYAQFVTKLAHSSSSYALVVCGHLHLLPFAHLLGKRFGCAVLPLVYGVDAWTSTSHASVNYLCRRIRSFVSIRRLTANRLKTWAKIQSAHFHYLPNCIDISRYGTAPRRHDLVNRYGLEERRVIMTAGRLDNEMRELNKGFDEVLNVLPQLAATIPNITYLIMGDGPDRPRLEAKARVLGIADRVIFTGYVTEAEKADHYRLADVVAMPGSNPYFDRYPFRFAFLEPLACGVPVVGVRLEDPSERDDPDAKDLVIQVDPNNQADIYRGIMEGLAREKKGIHPVMQKFTYEAFELKAHAILDEYI